MKTAAKEAVTVTATKGVVQASTTASAKVVVATTAAREAARRVTATKVPVEASATASVKQLLQQQMPEKRQEQ